MIKGIIFDLDGVIVSTDNYQYLAWKTMADKEGIPFDRERNNLLRGVSRRASLDIILEKATRTYTEEEKEELMRQKNEMYVSSLKDHLSPKDILPGFMDFLKLLRENGIKTAVGSSSKNTALILNQIELYDAFDAIADGTEIVHSKPDPEVFLLAAKKLSLNPNDCAVIEDAIAGIEAAKKGGMLAIGIKDAKNTPLSDIKSDSFEDIAKKLGL